LWEGIGWRPTRPPVAVDCVFVLLLWRDNGTGTGKLGGQRGELGAWGGGDLVPQTAAWSMLAKGGTTTTPGLLDQRWPAKTIEGLRGLLPRPDAGKTWVPVAYVLAQRKKLGATNRQWTGFRMQGFGKTRDRNPSRASR